MISRRTLRVLRYSFGFAAGVFGTLGVVSQLTLLPYTLIWYGSALLFAGLWLEQVMLYSYLNYRYYAGLNSILGRDELRPSRITYEVAVVANTDPHDLTAAFLRHPLGQSVWVRTELDPAALESFIQSKRTPVSAAQLTLPEDGTLSLTALGHYLLKHDSALARFLETHGVTAVEWNRALRWTVAEHIDQKSAERWWSKDNLLRTKSLGKSWSYGYTGHLNTYLTSVHTSAVFSIFGTLPSFASRKVDELSHTLQKTKAANALILGPDGIGKVDVVIALEQRISRGQAVAGLQHKRIELLNTEHLLTTAITPTELEQTLNQILDEATEAGNIILVIDHLSRFVTTAEERGVHMADLLDVYLAHPDLQIIATDTTQRFHNDLQPLSGLTRRFAQIILDIPTTADVVEILQQSYPNVAHRHNVNFTYPALATIAEGAKRYITDGVPPDSALALLTEIAEQESGHHAWITSERVEAWLTKKTGIPMGEISPTERDTLLHLEDTLHTHVVGQDRAIEAISDTLRRARVGIESSERPIGSFLFLGPTGVGKTETAKTLAEVFFGSREELVRFDMSEYSGTTALEHLAGSTDHTGTLSSVLHDKPYCVLLLDEFEKANVAIHDLFLQILDEGQYTDDRGGVVNARNTIIIATGNAGSKLIYKTTDQRAADPALNQRIIDHIIETQQFRPELINRFDNTIIFEPLQKDEQADVAQLMLRDLADRLHEKNYRLAISPSVREYILEHGYSEQFGARAMRREIQNTIESAIAEKIIANKLKAGDTITLTRDDIEAN